MPSPDAGDAVTQPDHTAWLYGLQRFGVQPGLARVHALLAAIGSPQRSFDVVLVAGTNGKGSTACVLAACLSADGRRTGLFVSPHLHHLGERATVDGVATSEERMADALATVRPHAERLHATFFEVVTAACALVFKSAGVKVAVMEVGMGGRLDATNALEPVLSIITGIALDHVAVLGSDVSTIAREKAGILRTGVPALTAASGPALSVIEDEAVRLGALLEVLGRDLAVSVEHSTWDGLDLVVAGMSDDPDTGLRVHTPLVGRHQATNVALAAAGAARLRVPRGTIAGAVASTVWPGRLERLAYRGRRVVLDGAHNPQAAEALAATIAELGPRCDVLMLGSSADKDQQGILAPLLPVAGTVVVTRAVTSPRASDPALLASLVAEMVADSDDPNGTGGGAPLRVMASATPAEALQTAVELTDDGGLIVVAGSLFLVGEVRSLLLGQAADDVERWQ